jgi:hypothetical protein
VPASALALGHRLGSEVWLGLEEVAVGFVRALGVVVVVFGALAAACALVGVALAFFRSSSYVDAIAYALCFGGATVLLLAAMAGSPAQRAADSRYVVGGRFVEGSDRPQPESPFVLIPASLLVIGLGALIFILAG